MPALPEADAVVHLRQRHAHQDPALAPDPSASAGAGQGARHCAAACEAFRRCHAAGRPVLAEPVESAGATHRERLALGGALSRLGARHRSRGRGRNPALNRKSEVADNQRARLGKLEGVVLLDGTWSQAKALWWRNPWMLKCQRVILNPT